MACYGICHVMPGHMQWHDVAYDISFISFFLIGLAASSRGTRWVTVLHANRQRRNNRAKACTSRKKSKKPSAAVNIAIVAERTTAISSTSAAHVDHKEAEQVEEEQGQEVSSSDGCEFEVHGENEEHRICLIRRW